MDARSPIRLLLVLFLDRVFMYCKSNHVLCDVAGFVWIGPVGDSLLWESLSLLYVCTWSLSTMYFTPRQQAGIEGMRG